MRMLQLSSWARILRAVGSAILLTLILLLVSPLLLLIPSAVFDIDWERFSAVGQSYTGVAAILSAAALVGVVYSISLQRRQNMTAQGQAVREMQFALLGMAMREPDLAAVLAGEISITSVDVEKFRTNVFRNQWLRYQEFGYLVGEISASELQRGLAEEFFRSPENRQWWSESEAWRTTGTKSFYDIAQIALTQAQADEDSRE